jgi:hypothetical protein
MRKYRLLKDLPGLEKGAIFEHRAYDQEHPDRGNMGFGCLILSWIDHDCQQGWCGETFIFPGQVAKKKDWFERIENKVARKNREIANAKYNLLKIENDMNCITKGINILKEKIEILEETDEDDSVD